MTIKLQKIKEFSVYNPIGKHIETDFEIYAHAKAILCGGTIYIRIRYKAIKRLQRRYYTLAIKNILPKDIDYPNLITIKN